MTCPSSLFGWFTNVNVTAVTSARRNLQNGLTNGSEANWASEVALSLFRAFPFLFDAALRLLNLPYHSSLGLSSGYNVTPYANIHHTHLPLCGGGKTRVPFWRNPCTPIETLSTTFTPAKSNGQRWPPDTFSRHFFAFVVFNLKPFIFMIVKNTVVSIKDRIL